MKSIHFGFEQVPIKSTRFDWNKLLIPICKMQEWKQNRKTKTVERGNRNQNMVKYWKQKSRKPVLFPYYAAAAPTTSARRGVGRPTGDINSAIIHTTRLRSFCCCCLTLVAWWDVFRISVSVQWTMTFAEGIFKIKKNWFLKIKISSWFFHAMKSYALLIKKFSARKSQVNYLTMLNIRNFLKR